MPLEQAYPENPVTLAKSLRHLLDNLEHSCAITGADGLFIYVNPAFLALYHYNEANIIGVSSRILLPGSSGSPATSVAQQSTALNHRAWEGEVTHVDRAGRPLALYLFNLPILFSPTPRPACLLHLSCPIEARHQLMRDFAARLCAALIEWQINLPPEHQVISPPQSGDRQRQISKLTQLGYRTKEIAALMRISISTVNVVKWKIRKHSARRLTPPTAEMDSAQQVAQR
jgi:PAS domain S-box-containing protein